MMQKYISNEKKGKSFIKKIRVKFKLIMII